MKMTRKMAIPYVSYVVDDALCGRKLGDDIHAIVRDGGDDIMCRNRVDGFEYPSVLIGWQCGFEPLFVAVHSYLDVRLSDADCVALALDYLSEVGWVSDGATEPDYIIR